MPRYKKLPSFRALRIVSLAPSCTSILWAIGAQRHVVGVTKWCKDVAPVRHLPALGDCWRQRSIDKIARLRPTLIVGSVPFHPDTVRRLLALPAQFLALNPRSLADIESDIMSLAHLTNRTAQGGKLVTRMRKQFAQIRSAAKNLASRPRVYAEAWPNPRISSPPWVAELIALCGGKMVVKAGARISDEEVAAVRPEVILLAWAATGKRANPQKTLAHSLWQSTPAIQHRHVYVIQDEILNTPGPPLLDGAREIYRVLRESFGGGP
jgi:iron complex transport system substrate-binding protein